jgi:5-formyltetrahydrofolate cyclo-ligase
MNAHAADQAPSPPNPAKLAMRREMLRARKDLAGADRARAEAAITGQVLKLIDDPSPLNAWRGEGGKGDRAIRNVSIYFGYGHEVATEGLIATLLARGLTVALPYVPQGERMLQMRVVGKGGDGAGAPAFAESLQRNAYGILEPQPSLHPRVLGLEAFDLAIVPGVAFDRMGNRLGYGVGIYDRWLAGGVGRGSCVVLGLAFAMQIVDAVPVDSWDRRVDGVVTESGLF